MFFSLTCRAGLCVKIPSVCTVCSTKKFELSENDNTYTAQFLKSFETCCLVKGVK